jgi:hypothetical protein
MVNAGEELFDIALEYIAVSPGQESTAIQSSMGALADAVSIAVVNKAALEDGLDDVADGVVYNAVTEGSGGYEAAFRLVDVEAVIGAGLIGPGSQFFLKLEQVGLPIELEGGRRSLASLAFAGLAVGQVQVLESPDLGIEVAICLHRSMFLTEHRVYKPLPATALRADTL